MNNPLFNMLKKMSAETKKNILIALAILVIVLFILPLINLNGGFPFASGLAKFSMLLLVFGAWAAMITMPQWKQYGMKIFPMLLAKIKQFWSHSKKYSNKVASSSKNKLKNLSYKKAQHNKKNRLRKLPWYLVLGPAQSGKKYCLSNSGLYFAKPEHFGDEATHYINQFPDYDWWFSEQAVLIDPMTYNKEDDTSSWKKFLKILRKERKNKPINGIVLTFSIADVMLYSNQDRQAFIQDTCKYIRDLHDQFKAAIPVYIVFTKCDLVEGFLEFFNDLSKEELRQIWGMTFPIKDCDNVQKIQATFQQEYGALVAQLRKRIMWSLDVEKSPRGREVINAFPQQMQLLRRPIDNFINELFGATRYQHALQLRGMYFTSSQQIEGETQDFLLQAMSKKFQLIPPKFKRPQRLSECYFMHNLFHEILLPEAPVLGESERSKNRRKLFYKLSYVTAPLLVIAATVGMYKGYKLNTEQLMLIDNHIDNYHFAATSLKETNDSLIATLPLIQRLDDIYQLYHNPNNSYWGAELLFATKSIRKATSKTFDRGLNSIFLPRVAKQLENNLQGNISDLNMLYATLKGYLAFSDNNYVNSSAIKTPLNYQWQRAYRSQPETNKSLASYLDHSLETKVEKLAVDSSLVDRIRSQLAEVIPSQRAYGLLELNTNVGDIPQIVVPTAIGDTFDEVFLVNNNLRVPAFYTRSGFEQVFIKQYDKTAREVAQDNRDIGLVTRDDKQQTASQISAELRNSYNKSYADSWLQIINNIEIKPYNNLDHAVESLSILVNENSPLPKLLNLVYDNTSNINHSSIDVSQQFNDINRFSQGTGNPSWNQVEKIANEMLEQLLMLQKTPDPDKASFDIAMTAIQGGENPIHKLTSSANKAPEAVKRWLTDIANYYWDIIAQGTHNHINNNWRSIHNDYINMIDGRYPADITSNTQISINNFNYFFAANGILDQFFKSYLSHFINTKQEKWELYKTNGLLIDFDENYIAQLQQAYSIQADYFSPESHQAELNFTVTPQLLDSNASSMQLVFGNQRILYTHGPQLETSLHWPISVNNEQASISITDFNNNQNGQFETGPWGIFKIIDKGNLIELDQRGNFHLTVNFSGKEARYLLRGNSSSDVFTLANIKHFTLPRNIAPTYEDIA